MFFLGGGNNGLICSGGLTLPNKIPKFLWSSAAIGVRKKKAPNLAIEVPKK